MRLTVGEAVVRALAEHGVDTVFGIPGTHTLGLHAHLGRYGIRHVTPRHEQGAGYAADGYARSSGRPGVLLVTSGPGVLNAATALAQAWSDSVPVLSVSPGMPFAQPARATGALHEARDQYGVMSALLGHAERVTDPEAAARSVRSAFAAFGARRPRPCHLEVPLDRVDAVGDVDEQAFVPLETEPRGPDRSDVARAAALLAAAARPGVVLGGGARAAVSAAVDLVEALGCGVVTSTNGKGTVPESHPQSLGCGLHLRSVQDWLRSRDVVLVVGCELAGSDTWLDEPVVRGRVVRVDLDPAQRDLHAPDADVMIVADAAPALAAIRAALPTTHPGAPAASAEAAAVRLDVHDEAAGQGARWAPLLRGLRQALPTDAVLTADNAMAAYYGAAASFPVSGPRRYLFPTGFGTLGYALPAAVGAALADPGRPVAALTGDGGLQFTVNELATAAGLGRPLPVVVSDNGGYGEIRAELAARGAPAVGVDLSPPDWAGLSAAYGADHVAVSATSGAAGCEDEVADAVSRALGRPRPTLVVVREEPA